MSKLKHQELVFVPLGGTGEIGMNLNLYGLGGDTSEQWIMVDIGVLFGDERTPGIDLIMADTRFIEERVQNLLGLVLTHGHEDHIGAIAHLWPRLKCPVYATPFTAELVRTKLKERGILDDVPLHVVPLGDTIQLGDFAITFIHTTHSILEPNALAIRTPLGNIMHTGDWKIDPDPLLGQGVNEAALRAFGDEGCLAIVCDSTNALSPGRSGSESEVRKNLVRIIGALKGRVIVTTFASNVARLETIARAAEAAGRCCVLVGRSMYRIVDAARAAGYLGDLPDFVDDDEADRLADDKTVLLCTGSQGEGRAALSRMADGSHRAITLKPADTVIFSSKIIPGNEKQIFSLHSRLAALGVHIITEHDDFIHVSGHPCQDELEDMYSWIRPRVAVPVHGEVRHLQAHADLAEKFGVEQTVRAVNGDVVHLAPGSPARIVDQVPCGRLYEDGGLLVCADDPANRERRKLSYVGTLSVAVVIDKRGHLAADPEVRCIGLPLSELDHAAFNDHIVKCVERTIKKYGSKKTGRTSLSETLRIAVRNRVNELWGKKPICTILVCQV